MGGHESTYSSLSIAFFSRILYFWFKINPIYLCVEPPIWYVVVKLERKQLNSRY